MVWLGVGLGFALFDEYDALERGRGEDTLGAAVGVLLGVGDALGVVDVLGVVDGAGVGVLLGVGDALGVVDVLGAGVGLVVGSAAAVWQVSAITVTASALRAMTRSFIVPPCSAETARRGVRRALDLTHAAARPSWCEGRAGMIAAVR